MNIKSNVVIVMCLLFVASLFYFNTQKKSQSSTAIDPYEAKTIGILFNYKTNESEMCIDFPPEGSLKNYIPQDLASQGLYDVYVAQGLTGIDAMGKVLSRHIEKYETIQNNK